MVSDFTLTTIFNLISFVGIIILLIGGPPVIGGSLITFGLFAFTLQILFHKI